MPLIYKKISRFLNRLKTKYKAWFIITGIYRIYLLSLCIFILNIIWFQIDLISYFALIFIIILLTRKDFHNFWNTQYLNYTSDRIKDVNLATESMRRTVHLDELINLVSITLTKNLRFQNSYIFILENKEQTGEVLSFKGGGGKIANRIKRDQLTYPIADDNILIKTIKDNRQFIVSDINNDHNSIKETLGLKEFATVPLGCGDKVFGVLIVDQLRDSLTGLKKRSITAKDFVLLGIFANQTAVSIENIRLYSQMEELLEKANVANKAKSDFLANMSHEFRTPMNAILGFSDILQNYIQDDVPKEYLNAIKSSGRSLLHLVNDILDLSKVEAGKMKLEFSPVNLEELINDIKQIFFQKINEKGLDFIIDIEKPIYHAVLTDKFRIQQILINLIANAIKFTDKGYIKVKVNFSEFDKEMMTSSISISVIDSGIGIAEDQKKIIFKSFEQHKDQDFSKFGGTGLGLSISNKIIKLLNGEITVESTLNKGSQFIINIPKIKVSPLNKESENKPKVDFEFNFKSAKIIIADTHSFTRKLCKLFINGNDIVFYETEELNDLIKLTQKNKPDLIIFDSHLANTCPIHTLNQFKTDPLMRNIPKILISSALLDDDPSKMNSICEVLLQKPFNKKDLCTAVGKYIEYEKNETPTNLSQKTNNISLNQSHYDEDLYQLLEQNFKPRWLKLKETMTINEIDQFAQELIEIAQIHENQRLEDWANTILSQALLFDINKLSRTLSDFEEIISSLKKVI